MSERGYRISSRRADGVRRIGVAFSLLVNKEGAFFLPVPAPHADDFGEITIESAAKGRVPIAVPEDKGELMSCCGYVAIPVDPFSLPPLPNLRPPSIDSFTPAVLTQVHVGTGIGHVARTRFRYELTNPNRTEFGTLVHLAEVSEIIVPLGSFCSSDLIDWGVVAAVDRRGQAVVATPLTSVLASFLQHGLYLATSKDLDEAFATRFHMAPFVLPGDVETVMAVFEYAHRFSGGTEPLVAEGHLLTFDDFMDAVERIGTDAALINEQDFPSAIFRNAPASDVDPNDEDGRLEHIVGNLWINYAGERVTLRRPDEKVSRTDISAASFLRQARQASAA